MQPKGSLDLKNCALSPLLNDDTFVITARFLHLTIFSRFLLSSRFFHSIRLCLSRFSSIPPLYLLPFLRLSSPPRLLSFLNSLHLTSSYMNSEYRLTSPGGVHVARAWLKVLQEAIETAQKSQADTLDAVAQNVQGDIFKSGWLEKKTKQRYFKLSNGILAWYNQNPVEVTLLEDSSSFFFLLLSLFLSLSVLLFQSTPPFPPFLLPLLISPFLLLLFFPFLHSFLSSLPLILISSAPRDANEWIIEFEGLPSLSIRFYHSHSSCNRKNLHPQSSNGSFPF